MANLDGLATIVSQLKTERTNLANQLRHVDAALSVLGKLDSGSNHTNRSQPTRIISAASRRKMAAAQRARWAKARNGSQSAKAVTGSAPASRTCQHQPAGRSRQHSGQDGRRPERRRGGWENILRAQWDFRAERPNGIAILFSPSGSPRVGNTMITEHGL